jgi:hypothetical protein
MWFLFSLCRRERLYTPTAKNGEPDAKAPDPPSVDFILFIQTA